jgi:hypothetical protein
MAIVLAGCAAPAPSATSPPSTGVVTPVPEAAATPDLASFGIPETVGSWHLVGEAQDFNTSGPTGAIITEAGGDPTNVQDLFVQASAGSDTLTFDALRTPGTSFEAFVAAAAPRIAALGTTQRSSRSVAGWMVIRYATPPDYGDLPRTLDYASRGDVILTFGNWTDEQLAGFLAAWP